MRVPKTKIIASYGPAIADETVIRRLMEAGLDVVRFNCSHGTRAFRARGIEMVRRVNRKRRRAIKILLDLEGPRVRVGKLKGGRMELKKNSVMTLRNQPGPGRGRTIPFDYPGDPADLEPAEYIFIDDGHLVLRIIGIGDGKVKARVVSGGELKERKGINIPGARLEFPSLTEKDEKNIAFAVEEGVDFLAQSFVRSPGDVEAVAGLVRPGLPDCRIIAKIECREGIDNVDRIIEAADGVMVARGDMGVSIPIYEVPVVQKRIIRLCNREKKLVITATEMLESMVASRRPTRAEVADVANAVLDGTDFVMLSAETAVGNNPVEAVKMMNQVIKFTEKAVREGLF